MFCFFYIVNIFHTIRYCLKRKRTLRSLSRYRIAMTIIDRADNGESYTDKGNRVQRALLTMREIANPFALAVFF